MKVRSKALFGFRRALGITFFLFLFGSGVAYSIPEPAILTLVINGHSFGDVSVEIDNEIVFFPSTDLLSKLSTYFSDGAYQALSSSPKETLSSVDLRLFGLRTSFDQSSLVFSITIPVSLMRELVLGAPKGSGKSVGVVYRPALLSGFANWALKLGTSSDDGEALNAFASIGVDSAINLGGWVAEYADVFTFNDAISHDLSTARLVKDFRVIGSRFTSGYLDLPRTTLQNRLTTVGFSLVSYPESALARETTSSSNSKVADEFEPIDVENEATISISLNGVVVKTEQVSPGRYKIGDLPFASGLNDVIVRIEEAGHAPVERRIGIAYDSSLLAPGDSRYGVGLGVGDADLSSLVFSGFGSLGTSLPGDLGLSLQIGLGSVVAGGNLKSATPLGLVSASAAGSWLYGVEDIENPMGFSGRLQYRLGIPGKPYLPSLGIGGQISTAAFSPPSQSGYSEAGGILWRLSFQASQQTPINATFSLAADYGTDDGDDYTFSVALGGSYPLGRGTTFSAAATIDDKDGYVKPELSVSLLVVPPGSSTSTTLRHSFVEKSDSVSLSSTAGSGIGALSFSGTMNNIIYDEDSVGRASATLRRVGSLADLSSLFSYYDDRDGTGPSYSAYAGAEGALVFAGGAFGLSRKVSDSFAILKPDRSFNGVPVELQRGTSSSATSTGGHSAVLNGLRSYVTTSVKVDAPGSPPEIAPTEGDLLLRPTYRSGMVIKPVRKTSVYVSGILIDASGAPIPWAFGAVLDGGGAAFGDIFTDETGRFEIYDLDAGTYRVQWGTEPVLYMTIEVPAGSDGELQLGAVQGTKEEAE